MLAFFTFFFTFFFSNFALRISFDSLPTTLHLFLSARLRFENSRSINDKSGGQTDCEINSPPSIPPLSTDRLTEETKAPWGHHRHIKRCWRMAGLRANLQLSSPGAIEEISLNLVQRTRVAAFFNRLSCSWLASSIGSTIAPRVTHAAIEIFSTAPNNRRIDHHPCNLRLNIGAIFLRVKILIYLRRVKGKFFLKEGIFDKEIDLVFNFNFWNQ